eukprot:1810201-Rhodomonas_salina.3
MRVSCENTACQYWASRMPVAPYAMAVAGTEPIAEYARSLPDIAKQARRQIAYDLGVLQQAHTPPLHPTRFSPGIRAIRDVSTAHRVSKRTDRQHKTRGSSIRYLSTGHRIGE